MIERTGMSVLVVDSDKIFREFVINNLLICGIKVYDVASSGEEALEKQARYQRLTTCGRVSKSRAGFKSHLDH
jgi:CheY-like chemotaxis protein